MHELSLVSELAEEATRLAAGRTVRSVSIRCPETLDADELRFAFELVSSGVLEGSTLEIEQTPVSISCGCGYVGSPAEGGSEHIVCCPLCFAPHDVDASVELVRLGLGLGLEPGPGPGAGPAGEQ